MQGEAVESDGFGPTVAIVDGESLYRWFVAEALGVVGMNVLQFKNLADLAVGLKRRPLQGLVLVDAQTLSDEGTGLLEALSGQFPAVRWVVLEPVGPGTPSLTIEGAPASPKPVDSEALRDLVRDRLAHAA